MHISLGHKRFIIVLLRHSRQLAKLAVSGKSLTHIYVPGITQIQRISYTYVIYILQMIQIINNTNSLQHPRDVCAREFYLGIKDWTNIHVFRCLAVALFYSLLGTDSASYLIHSRDRALNERTNIMSTHA